MFVLILMQPLFVKSAEIKANAMFAFKAKENMPAQWLWRIMTYLPLQSVLSTLALYVRFLTFI